MQQQSVTASRPPLGRLVLALVAAALALAALAPTASAASGGERGRQAAAPSGSDLDAGEVQTQIVGGDYARRQGHDWMVALVRKSDLTDQYCGGSLITPNHVLTAAHCVDDLGEQFELTVRVGVTDLPDLSEGERIDPLSFIVHPDWKGQNGEPDIAIIRLSRASIYAPIRVGAPGLHQAYLNDPVAQQRKVFTYGWGLIDGNGGDTDWLKILAMRLYSDQYMTSITPFQAFKPAHHIGAGAHEEPKPGGVSNGDSGGPLFASSRDWPERTVHRDYDGPLLLGVTNMGLGPAYNRDKFPGIWGAVDEGNLLGWVAYHVRAMDCGPSMQWRFASGVGPVCAKIHRVS